jgi:hypothetical protein
VGWVAELLLTELVANAVRHARSPFTVLVRWNGRVLRCEVTDANPLSPDPQFAVDPLALGGTRAAPDRPVRVGVGDRVHPPRQDDLVRRAARLGRRCQPLAQPVEALGEEAGHLHLRHADALPDLLLRQLVEEP